MTYKEFLEQVAKESNSKADFCRALDKKPIGANYDTINKLIKKYDLDVSHFRKGAWNENKRYRNPNYELEEILVENSSYKTSAHLKKRLIDAGLKENKCEKCGKTKRLELHHINGNHYDNRLENLQILCIECHYDTDNYRNKEGYGQQHFRPEERFLSDEEIRIRRDARLLAKRRGLLIKDAIELIKNSPNKSIEDFPKQNQNKNGHPYKLIDRECPICHNIFHSKRVEQIYCSQECLHKKLGFKTPEKQKLIETLKKLNCNITQVGKYFEVTDNAVRKWCKNFGLPIHTKELKVFLNC